MKQLPPELFLRILDCLTEGGCREASLTVLNLACSSRAFCRLVLSQAMIFAQPTSRILKTLQGDRNTDLNSTLHVLSVYCKQIGHICAICSNQARFADSGEVFTGLHVCRACESVLFPKISSKRLHRYFDITTQGAHELAQLKSFKGEMENQEFRLYQWKDIENLISSGLINTKRDPISNIFLPSQRSFSPEECSEFGNTSGDKDIPWVRRDSLRREILWSESLRRWNISNEQNIRPIVVEITLFKQFRYEFDPSFRHPCSPEEDIRQYVSTARYWTSPVNWLYRPWRLQNFPLPPRCSISNPYTNEYDASEDQFDYETYRFLCRRLRAVIRTFPNILCSPETWRRCFLGKRGKVMIPDAVKIASSAALSWDKRTEPLEFEIRNSKMEDPVDVELMRRGPKLPRPLPNEDVTFLNSGDIVRIDEESIEVTSFFIVLKNLYSHEPCG